MQTLDYVCPQEHSKMSFELLKRFRVTRETPILPLQGAGV